MGRFKTVVLEYLSLRSIQRCQGSIDKTTTKIDEKNRSTKNALVSYHNSTTKRKYHSKAARRSLRDVKEDETGKDDTDSSMLSQPLPSSSSNVESPPCPNQRVDRRRVQFNLQANQVYVAEASRTTSTTESTRVDPSDLWYTGIEFKAIRDQILPNIQAFMAQDMPRGALGIKALRNLYKECQAVERDTNQISMEHRNAPHHYLPYQKPQDSVSTATTTTREPSPDQMIVTRSMLKKYLYGDDDYQTTILGLERIMLGGERLDAVKAERRNTLVRCQQGGGECGDDQQQQQVQQKLPQQQQQQQERFAEIDPQQVAESPEWWRGSFRRNRNKNDSSSSFQKRPKLTPPRSPTTARKVGAVPLHHHPVSAASRASSQFARELAQQLAASLWEKA